MQQTVSKDREKYIGGSDVPIIMNISQFKTRYQLLLEKAQLAENDFDGNEFTEYGNVMEDKIRHFINNSYQLNFVEDKLEKDDIRCHYDGIDKEHKVILEVKTTSQVHDDVSKYKVYLVQLLFYMIHSNINDGILAVYERPDDFDENFDFSRLQVFTINIDDYKDLCVEIMEQIEQFRIDLKKLRENPFLTEQDLINTSVVEIANEILKIESQLKSYIELVNKYEQFKIDLKNAMEQNNIKKWETPNGTKFTLVEDTQDKEVETKEFNIDKFKEENKPMYESYVENKKVLKKGKKGYVKITLGGK